MEDHIEYVVGFAFDDDADFVCLIKKAKPAWQAGLMNGVGGKIEPGESPREAMIREFREETGLRCDNWNLFMELQAYNPGVSGSARVYFFEARMKIQELLGASTTTDEQVCVVSVPNIRYCECVPNLRWLVPMAVGMPRDRSSGRVSSFLAAEIGCVAKAAPVQSLELEIA